MTSFFTKSLLLAIEWDEFVAWRNGRISRDELEERARRRQEGREPVEPPGGSVQSSLTGWDA